MQRKDSKTSRSVVRIAVLQEKNSSKQAREMYEIVCADCGKVDKVPFMPRNDKPVYCSECFENHR